ncbi:hypothetical protein H8N00_16020 [Streptomyces sp. AC563]|uniref:hypothetical protein n=1 Tax=Streptomyces buecherae TaxID=2763006 RepID=UPI00164D1E0C|nr:hypothetical protein [Streptomyces buecherae]MBC3990355.1 hypothetical protein [Streptomyces buecherae]
MAAPGGSVEGWGGVGSLVGHRRADDHGRRAPAHHSRIFVRGHDRSIMTCPAPG